MSSAGRKSRTRTQNGNVAKDTSSRQTSLLDVFTLKTSLKKTTLSTSAAPCESESIVGEDTIDIPSSDAEPLSEVPVDSSSPCPATDDSEEKISNFTKKGLQFGVGNQVGGSREAPIFVPDSSPTVSPTAPSKLVLAPASSLPKSLYSIFAPRNRAGGHTSPHSAHAKLSARPFAPFPDESTQHVRGPQATPVVPLLHFTQRGTKQRVSDANDSDPSIYSRLRRSDATNSDDPSTLLDIPIHITRESCADSIPLNHRLYPAIKRLLDEPPPLQSDSSGALSSEHQLWIDMWHPRRADEVLGNEQSSLYLRDWLLALKLQIHGTDNPPIPTPSASDRKGKPKGSMLKRKSKEPRGTKRPRIVRDVERKRRRLDSEEPEDAWIADDDSEDDPLDLIDVHEDESGPSKLSRLKRFTEDISNSEAAPPEQVSEHSPTPPHTDTISPMSYTPYKFGETIYNTILLAGPAGCGKTAAVYACAEELGWDVFEVYPGIGERSGPALQKLIGEVGKNHLVRQTQHQPKAKGDKDRMKAKVDFFAKRVVSDDEADEAEVSTAQGGDSWLNKPEVAVVSQSFVLVEEVDLLYRGDTNFWPTMVKIIKECRRPVVMTCNDISWVPTQDLPLQTILHFDPCPPPLTVSYLRLLASIHGRSIEPDAVMAMYEGSVSVAVARERRVDGLLHPRTVHKPQPDLRAAITHLQFNLGATRQKVHDLPPADESAWFKFAKHIQLRSFVDSGLCRSKPDLLRDLLSNSASPCADDIIGLKHLVADPSDFTSHLPVTLSTYERDEMILDALLPHHNPSSEDFLGCVPDIPTLHTPHSASLLPVLDRLHVPYEHIVRNPEALFLDYEPWIRFMVSADDAQIAAYMTSKQTEGSTRRTRNSQRRLWEVARYIDLKDHERDILRRTAFKTDCDMDMGVVITTDPDTSQTSQS